MKQRFKLDDFLPFRLNMLAQVASQRLSQIYARRFGLDIPQWRILANLASRGAMTAQEIASFTHSHKSTISRAVAELEARNLIERAASERDRRAFALRLTVGGKKLFAELVPLVLDFEASIFEQMSRSEKECLSASLTALERVLLPTRNTMT